MRITDGMMVANTVSNINKNARRLSEAINRESTQKKIQLASDDPIVATRAIKYRNYVAKIEQYQKNVSAASSWQKTSNDALSDLGDIIQRVRELTVQASSDTLSDQDKAAIKTEVTQLQAQLVQVMNTSYAGRYAFGGYATDAAPYALVTAKAGTATYNDTGYAGDGSAIAAISGLTADTYTLSVATGSNGTDYLLQLTDSSGNVVAAADNVTATTIAAGGVKLTGTASDGTDVTITMAANTGTIAAGTSMTFDAAECNAVTFKGKYISIVGADSFSVTDAEMYVSNGTQAIYYNIGYGAQIAVNVEGQNVTGTAGDDTSLFDTVAKLMLGLDGKTTCYKADVDETTGTASVATETFTLDGLLTDLDTDYDRVLTAQADLGARMNYVDMATDRLANDYTNYTTLLSNNEDVDAALASTDVSTAEYVYEASLTVGAKAITKSLVDYIA
ncbi:MAG TPA: flagellar hook-associated protein FlgL [Methylomusa anaerophila]|uniref:Flagellar hook-associated protein 3 n=1 Tax=Methylomusa anaerophila TaxID=1930071 RepID=A0A348AH55_9FIRM|nr:flagellar hook-associated protein FlgL [Methylomusa anaerophila]BBB90403.1 flagellar hook-associated protein 3 [Methylomusa anaerophila]HML90382.1 flagellar hook-associated protein FlgL [Methylomusa anaerophila]